MLEIRQLSASIDGKQILKNISATFERGTISAIVGPNGSGKSTLAAALMGRQDITLSPESKIILDGGDITSLPPEKRAKMGIFLSFQNPPALPGISVFSLIRTIRPHDNALEIKRQIAAFSDELEIPSALRSRGIHDGFSGGEKKKFEVLFWALLTPHIAFFDEIDTGVDVDSIKILTAFIKKHRSPNQTMIFITHSASLLENIEAHSTFVMRNGLIERSGDGSLALRILAEDGFRIEEEISVKSSR